MTSCYRLILAPVFKSSKGKHFKSLGKPEEAKMKKGKIDHMIHHNDYCQKVSCWCGRGGSLVPIWRHFSGPAGCDFADEMFPRDSLAWSFAKRCSPLQFVASSVQPIRIPPPWPGETGCSALYVINRKFVQSKANLFLKRYPMGWDTSHLDSFPYFFSG